MTITHELGPNAQRLLTRLLDLVDGKQQAQIDALTKRLTDSGAKLEDVIDTSTPTP